MTDEQLTLLRMARRHDWRLDFEVTRTQLKAADLGALLDAYDAQAARIAELEHMAAAWIRRAYDRSRVDQATFAADLTSEELAVWRTDPEIAAALDATWEGYVNDHA